MREHIKDGDTKTLVEPLVDEAGNPTTIAADSTITVVFRQEKPVPGDPFERVGVYVEGETIATYEIGPPDTSLPADQLSPSEFAFHFRVTASSGKRTTGALRRLQVGHALDT